MITIIVETPIIIKQITNNNKLKPEQKQQYITQLYQSDKNRDQIYIQYILAQFSEERHEFLKMKNKEKHDTLQHTLDQLLEKINELGLINQEKINELVSIAHKSNNSILLNQHNLIKLILTEIDQKLQNESYEIYEITLDEVEDLIKETLKALKLIVSIQNCDNNNTMKGQVNNLITKAIKIFKIRMAKNTESNLFHAYLHIMNKQNK